MEHLRNIVAVAIHRDGQRTLLEHMDDDRICPASIARIYRRSR